LRHLKMENNLSTTSIPLALEREAKEKLKLFLMLIKKDNLMPVGETIGVVIAYNSPEAISRAKQDYPGMYIFYQEGNYLLVEELMKIIQLEEMKLSVAPIEVELPKMSKESFVASLKLVADDFLNPKDSTTLKKIIEKIK